MLRRNRHDNIHLQRSFDKHGESAFKFSLLEKCVNKNEILVREQHWLNKLDSKYNILPVAGNTTGRIVTTETRLKLSIASSKLTGSKNHWFGKRLHDNTINAAKRVTSKKFRGQGNPFWGKTHTEEVRRLLSEKLIGRKMPESFLRKQAGNTRGSKTYTVTFPDGRSTIIRNLKEYCDGVGFVAQNVRSAIYYGRKYRGHFFEVTQPLS